MLRSAVDRCAYPDQFHGAWTMDQTFGTRSLLTRAGFYGVDPAVANSTGNHFNTSDEQHGWNYNVEHITGLTINASALPWLPLSPKP